MKRTRKIHFLTCTALGMGAGSLSMQAIANSSIEFGVFAIFVIVVSLLNVACGVDTSKEV